MSGLIDEPDRQAVQGAARLAAHEAELLGDDPTRRGRLLQLAELLEGWRVAGDQAIAVRLRLLVPGGDGYTEADLDGALADYAAARGWVLDLAATITDAEREQHDPDERSTR